jgi:hypothetical protein
MTLPNIQSIPKDAKVVGVDMGKAEQTCVAYSDNHPFFQPIESKPMPVNIKIKGEAPAAKPGYKPKPSLLKQLGVPADLIQQLLAKKVKCISGASGLRFEYFPHTTSGTTFFDGESYTIHTLPINYATIQDIKNGLASELVKTQVCSDVVQVIMLIIETEDFSTMNGTLALLKAGAAKTIKTSPAAVSVGQPVDKAGEFPLSELTTAEPIKLRDATKLYQPTQGTSGGSRYYVVAVSDDLRMSARYNGASLSIRVEGPKFMEHIKNLAALGLEPKGSKGYASVHVQAPTIDVARKIVGAMIMGLGIEITSGLPDLQKIKGK